jgi:hypothetical protein
VPRQPRLPEIHAVAAQRDALSVQEVALALPLREAAVRTDDSVPWDGVVRGRKHTADEARRIRVDVAVRANESLGDLAHTGEDAGYTRLVAHRAAANRIVQAAGA